MPQEQSYAEVRYVHVAEWGDKNYFVSSDGRIFRVMEVRPSYAKGYGILATFDNHRGKKYRTIHSIVAEAFIGPRPLGLHINHIDGNKRNNAIENLEYLTASENAKHAWRIGLAKGRGHKYYSDIARKKIPERRRLSDKEAIALIGAYRSGGVTMKELGVRYRIPTTTVCHIIHGKVCYKELPRS